MKKLSFYIFISLIWFNVSYAQTLILFCSDNELIGFDGDSGYQQKSYKPLSFKLRIDMNKKFITSKDLGDSWTIEDFIKCNYWPAFDQYDPMLECMSVGYYIALNMNNYKFTRSRGYGFAFGNKDDIGTGYGTCERI